MHYPVRGTAKLSAFFAVAVALLGAIPACAENIGVVDIPNPEVYTKVVAISDVHGEYTPARKLLSRAGLIDADGKWTAGKTLLMVVGDSIDKGPQSLKVLELWQDLSVEAKTVGGRVVVLLGNHEAEYLADPIHDSKAKALHTELEKHYLPKEALADTNLTIDGHKLGAFLRDLPLAARVGNWLFCHSGWIANPSNVVPRAANREEKEANWSAFCAKTRTLLTLEKYGDSFFRDDDSILEKKTDDKGKKWWKSDKEVKDLKHRLDSYGLRGVVLGHQPGAFGLDGRVGPDKKDRSKNHFFKVDSGMAPVKKGDSDDGNGEKGALPGHLLVFTHPKELKTPEGPDFAHVFSVGFDVRSDGDSVFARKSIAAP
jgi:hypothetical protein